MVATMQWSVGDVTITKITETVLYWPFSALLPDVTDELLDEVGWVREHFVNDEGRMALSIHALVVESEVDVCLSTRASATTSRGRCGPSIDLIRRFSPTSKRPASAATRSTRSCVRIFTSITSLEHHARRRVVGSDLSQCRYLFGKTEFEHWRLEREPEWMADVFGDSVQPIADAGLADYVESDHRITSEVWLEPTPGHTPGHHSVRISSGGADAVITGDMVHHPVQFARPDIGSSADTDEAMAVATRREFLERYGDTPTLVIGTHSPLRRRAA